MAIAGFVFGAIASGSLKGGFQGAFSAMLFYGAGQFATELGGGVEAIKADPTSIWGNDGIGRALVHASAGCINAQISGGNCGRGAVTAGVGKYLSANLPGADIKDMGLGTVRAAVIGGTVSVLGGGKFANGARTAAYQYVFNQSVQDAKERAISSRFGDPRGFWFRFLDELRTDLGAQQEMKASLNQALLDATVDVVKGAGNLADGAGLISRTPQGLLIAGGISATSAIVESWLTGDEAPLVGLTAGYYFSKSEWRLVAPMVVDKAAILGGKVTQEIYERSRSNSSQTCEPPRKC